MGAPLERDAEYPEHLRDWLADLEARHFWFLSRARLIARAVRRRVSSDGGWLELGCGNGRVLAEVSAAYGGPCAGQDISLRALSNARRNTSATLFLCALESVPLADLAGVGLFDVLEHLPDDRTALEIAANYLRPGGLVLATVPAHPFLWSNVDVAAGHRRRYTRAALVRVVRSAGLELEFCRPFFALLLVP